MRIHDLDEPELDFFNIKMVLRLGIKASQRLGGKRRTRRTPTQGEMIAATGNGNIEYGFDLPEVFIQRSAQVGKTLVIGWREGKFERAGFQRPCKRWSDDLILAAAAPLCKKRK